MLWYQLFPIALRSWLCWKCSTVSQVCLNDSWTTVSMSLPTDTCHLKKVVTIVLATHEWPSQVTDLSTMNIPVKSNSHLFLWTINSMTSESYLMCSRILFSLLRHLYKYLCYFHVKPVPTCTAMWLYLLEWIIQVYIYVHLCLSHCDISNS